jgi:hypothetical protein
MDNHEFQKQRPRQLSARMIQPVPRNISEIAAGRYPSIEAPPDNFDILRALQRKANFLPYTIQYTTTPTLVFPAQSRIYFFAQNLDTALNLWIGFGVQPSASNNVGVKVGPGLSIEPGMIPQNDVWFISTGTGFAHVLIAID